jgi:ubiquinone/menaquinone biosynthesis C-methylase UbiE
MGGFKFDPEKLDKLNDPERLKDIPPGFIWKKLAVKQSGTVVDLGAGTGFFSMHFAGMPGVKKVYALDISPAMVEYMQSRVNPEYPAIIPMIMEESTVPLSDDTADVLIMINLHHEFHAPHAILSECIRVLKPGGKIAIVDWAKKDTEHGPPVEKRYHSAEVIEQLETLPFIHIQSFYDLPSHFLLVAENGKL